MNEIYVGRTRQKEHVALSDSSRTGHVQIVGATGRGKTESVILPWLIQDVIQGKSTILIDGKGDPEIVRRLKVACDHSGVPRDDLGIIDLGNLEASSVTNPLYYGSPQQVTDRIFSSFIFEKEYFKSVAYDATLSVVRLMSDVGEKVTFKRLYELLSDDDELSGLVQKTKPGAAKGAERLLAQSRGVRLENLSGLLSQLSPFADGELSPLVNATGDEDNFVSLTETLVPSLSGWSPKKAVLILLPSLLYQEAAARLGKMFLQEIAWAVGYRESTGYRTFASIFLDEFGSFVYPGFINLLNKARSTNTAIHLSHQSLGDIEAVSPEFATALHTNTNVKCILGINDPDSADFFAKHFGTKEVEKTTERAERHWFGSNERTGQMSVRDVEEYKVHPNRLRNFSQGMGVLGLIVNGTPVAEEIQFARAPF
jgi:hypothetical protein